MFLVDCIGSGPWVQGCGNVCIPTEVAKITSMLYGAIKVIVPIALVIIGMFDMAKAITTKSEDEVKKAQKLLVQKAIAGALVFILFSGITWMLSILSATSGNANREDGVVSCLNVLFGYNETTSTSGDRTYTTTGTDTLKSIANKYNVTVDALRSANSSLSSIDENTAIAAGTTVTIPGSFAGNEDGYTDVSGICRSNGYTGDRKIYLGGSGTSFYYTCVIYDKNDKDCGSGGIATGEKYTFADGGQYCLSTVSGSNIAVVYEGGSESTTVHAACTTNSTQDACDSCCKSSSYRAGYLLANTDGVHRCMCVKKY